MGRVASAAIMYSGLVELSEELDSATYYDLQDRITEYNNKFPGLAVELQCWAVDMDYDVEPDSELHIHCADVSHYFSYEEDFDPAVFIVDLAWQIRLEHCAVTLGFKASNFKWRISTTYV